ncbi:DUF6152 family protein [Luteimonas sp. RIT-PG2_3]
MTPKQRLLFPLAAALLLVSTVASAHHSFAAMFDANKPIRLTGKLTKIEWTNPHSYFHIDVVDARGAVHSWAIEGAGPGALSRRGFGKGDIKIGDVLVINGYLAKTGARIVDGRLVTLPDGRVINGGTPGDGGPGDPARTPAAAPATPAR